MPFIDDIEIDEAHPIPNLGVIDVWTVLKAGGCDMAIIIATPLGSDPRSMDRLTCKLKRYLLYLKSSECIARCGDATAENTNITVVIHPDSSPTVFEFLRRNEDWVRFNDATLVVETRGIVGVAEH